MTCLEKIYDLPDNPSIERYFTGASVLANYGNYKYYKIDSISFTKTVENVTFINKQTQTVINLVTYYEQNYQLKITDLKQPLFCSLSARNNKGERDLIYLVPELLLMTGIDEEMKSNENFKKDITTKTKLSPAQRLQKINEIKEYLTKTNLNRKKINKKTKIEYKLPDPNEIREEWGLEIGKNLEVTGRLLEKPQIQVIKGSKKIYYLKLRL